MRKPMYMIDFERTINIHIDDNIYEFKTSSKDYHLVLECIKKSKCDEILKLLQKI